MSYKMLNEHLLVYEVINENIIVDAAGFLIKLSYPGSSAMFDLVKCGSREKEQKCTSVAWRPSQFVQATFQLQAIFIRAQRLRGGEWMRVWMCHMNVRPLCEWLSQATVTARVAKEKERNHLWKGVDWDWETWGSQTAHNNLLKVLKGNWVARTVALESAKWRPNPP